MHRVELKDMFLTSFKFFCWVVPNAPCGVESFLVCTKAYKSPALRS